MRGRRGWEGLAPSHVEGRSEPGFTLGREEGLLVSLVLRHRNCFEGEDRPSDEPFWKRGLPGEKGPREARLDGEGPKTGLRQRNFPGYRRDRHGGPCGDSCRGPQMLSVLPTPTHRL